MTMYNLFDKRIINDSMEITVSSLAGELLANGKWFNDNVLDYIEEELECFTWLDNRKMAVVLKPS